MSRSLVLKSTIYESQTFGILQKLASGEYPLRAFHDAADAAEVGALATKTMLAQVIYIKRPNPILRFTCSLFAFVS